MSQDLKVTLRIDGETGKVRAEVKGLEKDLKDTASAGTKAGKDTSKSFKEAENSGRSLNKRLDTIKSSMLALGALAIGSKLAKEIVRAGDEYKTLNARIDLVTDSQNEFNKAQSDLFAISQETRVSLGTTVDLYTRLERSLEGQSIAQSEVLGITRTVNQALAVSGATAAETSSVITQLSQGLAAGALRGEEFNAVNESGSRVMQALKDELGKTSGELREMAFAGELTTEVITQALKNQSQAIGEEFGKLPVTVEGALQRVANANTKYFGELDDSVGITDKLAGSLTYLSENLDDVYAAIGTVFEVSLLLGGAKGLGLLITRFGTLSGVIGAATARTIALGSAMKAAALANPGALALMGGYAAWKTVTGLIEARNERISELKALSDEAYISAGRVVDALARNDQPTAILLANKALESQLETIDELIEKQRTMQRFNVRGSGQYSPQVITENEEYTETTNAINRAKGAVDALKQSIELAKADSGEFSQAMSDIGNAYQYAGEMAEAFGILLPGVVSQQEKQAEATREANEATDKWIESQEKQLAKLQQQNEYFGLSEAAIISLEAQKQRDLASDEKRIVQIDRLEKALIKETNALEAKEKAAAKSADALQRVYSVIEALKGEHRPIQVMFEGLAESLAALNDVPIGPKFTQEDYDEGFDLIQDQAEKLAKDIVDKVTGIYEKIPKMFGDVVDEIEDIELSNIFDGFADGLNPAISALGQFKDEINTISLLTQSGKFTAGQEAFYKTGLTAEFALNSMASMAKEGSEAQQKLAAAAAITNTILGITAILEQGKGDPYTAFARMAAMAAMVASLGVQVAGAFGGSGGGGAERQQEVQGTGTVLGDANAKSESINNSLDIIAEASEKIVGINSSMLRSLNAMNSAITGTATQIAQIGGIGDLGTEAGGFGGLSEIFGGTGITSFFDDLIFGSSRVTDQGISILSGRISEAIDGTLIGAYEVARRSGLFGSSTRTNTGALAEGISSQIGLIFESMTDAVLAGADALGLNMNQVQNAIDSFRIEEQRISLMDLSPEEQQAELEAVFSSIFDGLTEYAIPFITQFQAAGEGLGETLARVSTTVLVFEEAIQSMGLEFIQKQVDPELFAQAAVAISDFAGGMDAFIDGYTNYVSNFLSDDQQLEILGDRMSGIFDDIDLDLPATREGFTDLIQGLDLTTAAGQEAFGTLIALSSQMDSYYDGLEESQQRAADAMDRFFANFYSDDELLNRSIGQSSDLLAQQASNIGLDPTMTMAEFRALFNEKLPELTDAQIAQWLEFSETLVRVTDLEEQRTAALQAELEALQAYNDFAGSITDQIAELTGNGASEFEQRIAEIDSGLQSNIDTLNDMAIAAGLAGASEEDLANAHRLAALQTEQAIGILRDATQSLIDELYGDQAQSQVDQFSNSLQSGISNVSQAGSNLFSQWESALQRIDDYTNSLLTNEQLSPLEAPERLAQARADFYDLVAAANAGDIDAAAQVQPAMQEFLQILRDVERSGEDYNSEFYAAIAAAQGITAPTGGGESVTVGPSQAYIDYTNQQREQDAAAMAAHRLELSQALAEHVSQLAQAINQPVLQLFTDMGGDIETFLTDLGIDVSAATGETTAMLANLAQTLNIEVTELADHVGLSLGSLADAQSLLNDGLEFTIDQLPDGIQNTLEPLLRDVENAADGTEQEAALAALETATAGLPTEYRNVLAPYFNNIDPTSELSQQYTELQSQTSYLMRIARNTQPDVTKPAPDNSYAVGTPFVPEDQIAQVHKGEMIIPAREAGILRGMGVNVVPQSNKEVVEQLKRVEAELKSMKAMQRGKFDEQTQIQGQISRNTEANEQPRPIPPRSLRANG